MNKAYVLIITILLIGGGALWGQESTKGNWTESDKKEAYNELSKQREIFETFLDSTQIDPLINCIVDELEATYDNPDSVKTDNESTSVISLKCLDQIGFMTEQRPKSSSVKGNWSDEDLKEAYASLEYSRGVMNNVIDSNKVDLLFDCVVKKLEARYTNMDEALNDPNDGISNVTMECLEEEGIFDETQEDPNGMIKEEKGNPNSDYGNWSDADKALLQKQLDEMRPQFESNIGKEKTDKIFECIKFNFEHAFKNYADINNHPDVYKGILDDCKESAQ